MKFSVATFGFIGRIALCLGLMLAPLISNAATFMHRGVNISANLKEGDGADLARIGVNVVRVNFDNLPLRKKSPPYEINVEAFDKLDQIISWCKSKNISIILDLHTFPGLKSNYFTDPTDSFFVDVELQKLLIETWSYIARRYSNESTIFAYDLLNEPSFPIKERAGTKNWNLLVGDIVKSVRRYDSIHYFIIEPAIRVSPSGRRTNRVNSIEETAIIDDAKVIYSPHVYLPMALTHMKVGSSWSAQVEYPGVIDGEYWDKERLRLVLEPIDSFQKKYEANILIGEFSASNFAGASGDAYVSDLLDIFEEKGWSWTYHDFRGSEFWNPEFSLVNGIMVKNNSSPRLSLLKKYFKKNSGAK